MNRPLAAAAAVALALQGAPAAAQQAPPTPQPAGAGQSPTADADAGGGSSPLTWILIVAGSAVAAVGAGILVVGAVDDEAAPAQAAPRAPLDPGLSGPRGRANEETAPTPVPEESNTARYDAAGVVIAAGTVSLAVGLYLLVTGDDSLPSDEREKSGVPSPRVWRNGRSTGLAFSF